MQENLCELNKLKVKNFPLTFSSEDKRNFMKSFGASDVEVSRDFVIGHFIDEIEATKFLKTFHQKEILGYRLRVEYFTKKSQILLEPTPETSTKRSCTNINDYLLKWLAINSDLDFNQPPPPYLRYKYPKATREIIDSICVALESVPKFYTQVLHLMNKMNLPPPFTQTDVQKTKFEKRYESVSCQTEISNVNGRKRKISGEELLSDESELETDDEEGTKPEIPIPIGTKRIKKQISITQNPAKRFLQAQKYAKSVKKDSEPVFEALNVPILHSKKITLHVPSEIARVETPIESISVQKTQEISVPEKSDTKLTRNDLATNRLTSDQLSILPVFKNYRTGERSNKLYIKNLAKSVTSEDLQAIYGLFVKKNTNEIEIKLMQSGRMKGQAFITFNTPYDEEDLEMSGERMIDKALKETNGYLLKDKPMVVMYGKSS